MITGINHVGICVKSIESTMEIWKKEMPLTEIGRASYPEMGQTSAMIKIGDSYIELMEPIGGEGVVANFLKKRGEGIHHISLHSDSMLEDKAAFEAAGTHILGKEDDPVLFTHPKSSFGVIFEITESRNEKVEL